MPGEKVQNEARPLCWWSPAQQSQFAQFVRPVWEQWLDDWVVNADVARRSVHCSLACKTPEWVEQAWMPLGGRELVGAWLGPVQIAVSSDVVFGLLTGGSRFSRDSMAAALWREAHADLRQALCTRLELTESDDAGRPQAEVFSPWIGGLIVSLGSKGSERGLNLLADAQTVGRVLAMSPSPPADEMAQAGPHGGLHPVEATMAAQRVQLHVNLASCELDLGALSSLRVGDILPIPHALDDPMTVALHELAFCAAYLGRRGGAKAIALTHADSATLTHTHNVEGKK